MRGGNNMTEPSQYFKGRTVQEQMNEVIGYVDVRSAEVATDAIASDVAQVHQDMLDADADAQAAAASAAAAAGTLANAVKKTGEASQSITGDIAVAGTLSGGVVTGTQVTVPTPVNNTDAATKKYVDDADALLVPITNINMYAVGLTGNQNNITGDKKFVGSLQSNLNKINRIFNKIQTAGEYVFAQIPGNDNANRFVIDYTSRSSGISRLRIDSDLSAQTLTVNAVFNSAQNAPVFNLYSDGTNQYLGVTCLSNDNIEISGGTFHMRGSSPGQQLIFLDNFVAASGYTKITNN